MKTAVIRLDGVLVPSIWRQIAQTACIPELISFRSTDEAGLLQQRLSLLQQHRLRPSDLKFIISMYSPLKNARTFIRTLRREYHVIAVSNAIPELARYFTKVLDGIELHTEMNCTYDQGLNLHSISSIAPAEEVVKATAKRGGETLVIGNLASDIPMLKHGTKQFFFRPPYRKALIGQDIPIVQHYNEIIDATVDRCAPLRKAIQVEPPRKSRRLQHLREWSHEEEINKVFPRIHRAKTARA